MEQRSGPQSVATFYLGLYFPSSYIYNKAKQVYKALLIVNNNWTENARRDC